MFKRVISLENLFASWREFCCGKRDRPDVQLFERYLEDNIFQLVKELSTDAYRHGFYHTFHIRDPKPRVISKATVRDRLVHHLVFRELYRIFNPTFIYHSYSSRLDKGTHLAVANLASTCRRLSRNYTRPIYALKCDVKKFFAGVSHQKLLAMIQNKIKDTRFFELVKEIVESFNSNPNNSCEAVGGGGLKGLPIGNVTSQIFANIYLNELDQFIKNQLKIKNYFRYADDFVILHPDRLLLEVWLDLINDFVQQKLGLELHVGKTEIRKLSQGIDFLGYVVLPRHIVLRTKTKRRMFRKLRQKRLELESGQITPESYNQTLQSYLGILKQGENYELMIEVLNVYSK
ncbi:MAG: reverse transcriptase/maturase family protein [Patescibacteria group bacterium]